ncbi:MAG: hypothetical protein JWM33_392 [Caulobacteraceae bacterium]|nr:hypothetical protein [Caulobacteraceae bacterium]
MALSVGQTLFYVPERSRWAKPRDVTVEKVGRKWATLADNAGRIDVKTLRMDGGGFHSPGDCYLSRAEWEESVQLDDAWRPFRNAVARNLSAPNGITIEAIYAAAKALGFSLEKAGGEAA